MKKTLKIIFGILVFLLLILLVAPILFQDKIIALLKEKINENINAKIEFADANLSLIKRFPNASIELTDIAIINNKPFEGDTLFYGKEVSLKISLRNVIKGDNINIKSFTITDAKANILVDKNGKGNYDIIKEENTPKQETKEQKTKKIAVDSYAINHLDITYHDKKSNTLVTLSDFNHSGSGDLSADVTQLKTKTYTTISVLKDSTSYAKNIHLDLRAILELDLKNNVFSFLENEAHINQLPLIFDGFVKTNPTNQEVDINFKTPSSDFKNFLQLIPKKYAKNISEVKTSGDFNIVGKVNGVIDETHIPKFDIKINSKNASFKFPELPKSVNNIHLDTKISNHTGIVDNTFIDINNITFKIDENTFRGKGKIKKITTNPIITASLKGKLNLSDIDKVYPFDESKNLSGIVDANLTTEFDVEALEKNITSRIKNNGKISINDFLYNSEQVVNPIAIKNATVDFKPTTVSLTNFEATTGNSDFNASGRLQNILGFLLSDKKLKGKFALSSNTFKISDFMEENTEEKQDESEENQKQENIKIPGFLDIVASINAKNVYYDNLNLQNVTGTLILKDEKAVLQNVNANMFDGKIALNGLVDTKPETPVFKMNMGIQDFNIGSSFSSIKMFEKLAPIATIIDGTFNTNMKIDGALQKDYTPNLSTIAGNAFAEVMNQKINPEKSKAMQLLGNKLQFLDPKKLNLKDIKTHLKFKDGKVNVKPFTIKYQDIDVKIGGSHGFDQTMDYKITMDVPAKYLGSEISDLLTKLGNKNTNQKVPVTANLSGGFDNPIIKTDMSSIAKNLTASLLKQQKEKLVGGAIDKLFGKKEEPKDSTNNSKTDKTDNIKKGVKDILGIFGKKKKKENQ